MNLDARRLTSKGFSCLGTESHVLQRLIALYAGLQLHMALDSVMPDAIVGLLRAAVGKKN